MNIAEARLLTRRLRLRTAAIATLAAFAITLAGAADERIQLALPTENDALFRGDGPAFYQHIERDYQGEKSTPWEGGRYGFVRNPVQTRDGFVYSRFHEGIDIRPLERDAAGEPLDEVRAIAGGAVVYTNTNPAWSNYGNYIVIEHRWGGSPYYSLYGHLKSIDVKIGRHVARGEHIAQMGYTGEGLNQERAHVHLELNIMLSREFESSYETSAKTDPNHHGIYNGINLIGLDIARLYLALRKQPDLTIPEFLAREETFYRVKVPASKHFDLAELYPWLMNGAARRSAREISFNRAGVPLKIVPAPDRVAAPTLSFIRQRKADYSLLTRNVVGGNGANPALTDRGAGLMKLLTWPN
jgi:murein DD-endopeptidase MepM/ murein hydrolase activator NlpD